MHQKTEFEQADREWMLRALALAALGRDSTFPNPMVGAVIVKDGRVISEGYHRAFGGPHAEIEALSSCQENPSGATLYVTLEPCCHYGKTPPCTEAVIKAGISRVVVGAVDPNPLVRGKGIEQLKNAGIQVSSGMLGETCQQLNKAFNHYMAYGRPYVILKAAMSLDGKIATRSGESQWITGEEARAEGHKTRGRVRAIMAGIGTVLADDPLLTCRTLTAGTKQPVRIVLDKQLELPTASRLVKSAKEVPLWVVTTEAQSNSEKALALTTLGVKVLTAPLANGHFDWNPLLKTLGLSGVDSLLLEGGGILHDSALRAGIVDEVHFYIAPLIIGGEKAKGAVGGLGFESLSEAVKLKNVSLTPIGTDWLYKGMVDHMAGSVNTL